MSRYTVVVKRQFLNQVTVDKSNPLKPVTQITSLTEEQEVANLANYNEVRDYIISLNANAIFTEFPKYGVLGAELNDDQKMLVEKHEKVSSLESEILYKTCGGAMPTKKGQCCGGGNCS